MSETELSVICKNCGSEVSPYVTECPYCGARLRKRAPQLERRGDGLEAKPRRRPASRLFRVRLPRRAVAHRPYATLAAILAPALLLIVQQASGESLASLGALTIPFEGEWWRYLTAPFVYADVGYLFVVAIGLAIFCSALERRLGSAATAVLLIACGSLGMLAAGGISNAQGHVETIAGGNGVALGVLAAWFAIRRAETHEAIDQEYDPIGVAVAAAVLLALPIFESTADVFAGLAGAAVGGLAGLAAAALRSPE
ncbi:MAG TPA: rhomboid family intramembrane serine protease [Solirubrobacterales bacterium]|jgi:membrane associated rhomboid family serine protease|nr:rhomboid family intramembrane serine protease [Solirubrobacterales bacterium]